MSRALKWIAVKIAGDLARGRQEREDGGVRVLAGLVVSPVMEAHLIGQPLGVPLVIARKCQPGAGRL